MGMLIAVYMPHYIYTVMPLNLEYLITHYIILHVDFIATHKEVIFIKGLK